MLLKGLSLIALSRGSSLVAVCGLLIVAATRCGAQAPADGLNSRGSQALLLHGMWDLPGPGIEHVSYCPLAGRLVITGPPGTPHKYITYVQSSFHRTPLVCVDAKLLTCGCLLRHSIVNIKTMGLWWLGVTYSTPVQWDLVT